MAIATGSELRELIERASALAADEVVTKALTRDIALPDGAGTLVLITLDNGLDHKRPNTFGPKGLGELNRALDDALARDDIAAIAVTGKPFILAAGADLGQVGKMTSAQDAMDIARIGHGVFDRLRTSPVPTFAYINGLALGGGLEVNLNCRYRTINATVPAIGLPECFLGLVPGWGGAWLLPNLIGPRAALQVIITNPLSQNRLLTGQQAYDLGLADAVFDAADFLEQSIDWTAKVITGEVTVDRRQPARDDSWDAAVAEGRAFVDAKVAGAAPAPYLALDLVQAAKTATADDAFDAEDRALSDLIMSEELRSGLYAFDLVQKRAKRPAGAPDPSLARPVTKVGVVGAGLMASQLALLFVRRLGVPVIMSDLDLDRARAGVARVHAELDALLAKKRISPDERNRFSALVSGTDDQTDFADCDFVIEAVFEEIAIKKSVFAGLESIVSPECVLASNTSSLSITEMAADLQHPDRVVGFHFFNPVAVMPLLEIVKGPHTDDATLATAFTTAKALRKNAVLVSDATGFVVNRVLLRLMAEVFRAIDEGTPIEVADAALAPLGLPMSPLELLQLVGPAVALHVNESLRASFGDRFWVSSNLAAIVEAGKPGFLTRHEDGTTSVPDDVRALLTTGDGPSTGQQVLDRVGDALATEIRQMLDDGVVAAPQDIDLCLVLGAGWPFHLGGITPYLDRVGYAERSNRARFLPRGVASLP